MKALLPALVLLTACADEPRADRPACTAPAGSTYSVQRDPLTRAPFRWPSGTCVRYAVADTGLRDIPGDELTAAIEVATAVWTVDCAPICFESGGTEPASSFGYADDAPRQTTLLYWVTDEDAWRARHSEAAVAITTVLTRPATGEIVDADIELNAFGQHRWTTDTTAPSADVVSVVAHELGHVLGLGHDTDERALMFGGWEAGWLERNLQASDRAGICWLYACQDQPGSGAGAD